MKNRLEELRKERGIKQEELASVLKVSRQTRWKTDVIIRRYCWRFELPDILK